MSEILIEDILPMEVAMGCPICNRDFISVMVTGYYRCERAVSWEPRTHCEICTFDGTNGPADTNLQMIHNVMEAFVSAAGFLAEFRDDHDADERYELRRDREEENA